MTHLCELCKQAPLVPAPTWIPALKRKPAVSGTYRVRFFTGVEGKLYWNAEAGCWQRTSAPAKQRNVHRHVQHLMDSNNAAWLEQSSKEGSTHKSSQIPTGEYDHDVERIRVMNAECEAAVCYPPEGIGRKRNPKGGGGMIHEEYAKRLIRAKVGYSAETIPVKDCLDLMLQFSEAEMRIANDYHKVACDALDLQLPKPFLTLLEKDGAL